MSKLVVCLACALALSLMGPASGAPKYKVLGTDPENDAPPALDLTSLTVGRVRKTLEIRIGIANMLPVVGGYESLPAILWAFDAGPRTFAVEAYIEGGQPQFLLVELLDGEVLFLEDPEGTYDWTDGYVAVFVPLKGIGARRGTVVSGAEDFEGEDANSHIHLVVAEHDFDLMGTTKPYRVP